jgi:hypothetical protein
MSSERGLGIRLELSALGGVCVYEVMLQIYICCSMRGSSYRIAYFLTLVGIMLSRHRKSAR